MSEGRVPSHAEERLRRGHNEFSWAIYIDGDPDSFTASWKVGRDKNQPWLEYPGETKFVYSVCPNGALLCDDAILGLVPVGLLDPGASFAEVDRRLAAISLPSCYEDVGDWLRKSLVVLQTEGWVSGFDARKVEAELLVIARRLGDRSLGTNREAQSA
ncbi:hypothetical protein NA57DRAFT_70613 [Rhizodiscina lignyota]|uniref:Uncharacterized protein n=1 Tax=Rhizodiscina lignyota TaxID=1504668 RepID=A0A9P4IMS7_9PEZI|nr:hypothetical protein NA57DRAFT_70613 [Rhizodiscina lignyota]